MSVTRLLIARHGNTFAPGDVVTRVGKTDLPLVESGLQQGGRLGAYLRQHELVPDVIFTSALQRTIETAKQAQAEMDTHLPQRALSLFDEIDYGEDENRPESAVVARLGEAALTAWDADAIVPDGWRVDTQAIIQHWKEFADEMRKVHGGETILVVTSNGIARFAPHITGDFDAFRKQYAIKLSTGALGVFEYDSSAPAWHCRGWNIKPARL